MTAHYKLFYIYVQFYEHTNESMAKITCTNKIIFTQTKRQYKLLSMKFRNAVDLFSLYSFHSIHETENYSELHTHAKELNGG